MLKFSGALLIEMLVMSMMHKGFCRPVCLMGRSSTRISKFFEAMVDVLGAHEIMGLRFFLKFVGFLVARKEVENGVVRRIGLGFVRI